MLKKEIKFIDPFTDEEITQTYYFNLTQAEITEWEWSVEGGLGEHLTRIVEDQNGKEIMAAMKELILKSYGKRDGSNFIKNEQLRAEFESSEPYSVLFVELCTDADAAAQFMNSIVPKELTNQQPLPVAQPEVATTNNITPRKLTQVEIREMDSDELKSGLATGKYIL